jgi:hypothetical protein
MTQPGIGPVTALAFVLTIGDVKRFDRSKHVASYPGLIPRESSSGRDRQIPGHQNITRNPSACFPYILRDFLSLVSFPYGWIFTGKDAPSFPRLQLPKGGRFPLPIHAARVETATKLPGQSWAVVHHAARKLGYGTGSGCQAP